MFGRKPVKQHLIEVIGYEGPQDVFIWKHPAEDFNTKSQLVVHESQEAVFFRNGQALDLFPAGRYTLETQNLPLVRKVVGLATGGVSPFHCEVYFINKAVSMGIDWGTDSPIEIMDLEYGVPVLLRAHGDYSLRVRDGRKLLVKLAGTVGSYTHEEITRYFREILGMYIRDTIANAIARKNLGCMHINSQLRALAQGIKEQLAEVFDEYGLELHHFTVSQVRVDGLQDIHDTLKRVKLDTISETGKADVERIRMEVESERIQTAGSAKNAVRLGEGLVEAQINEAKGITEAQRMAFGVAEKLAGNAGAAVHVTETPWASGGPPVKAAIPAVSAPAEKAADIVNAALSGPGRDEERERAARKARLRELKEWLEEGLITEQDYNEKKQKILDML